MRAQKTRIGGGARGEAGGAEREGDPRGDKPFLNKATLVERPNAMQTWTQPQPLLVKPWPLLHRCVRVVERRRQTFVVRAKVEFGEPASSRHACFSPLFLPFTRHTPLTQHQSPHPHMTGGNPVHGPSDCRGRGVVVLPTRSPPPSLRFLLCWLSQASSRCECPPLSTQQQQPDKQDQPVAHSHGGRPRH